MKTEFEVYPRHALDALVEAAIFRNVINRMMESVHQSAVNKGFYNQDGQRNFGELIAQQLKASRRAFRKITKQFKQNKI